MAADLSLSLRQLVAERAGYRCEYCLLPQAASLHRHEPDHIVPRQHDGETREDNLAFACLRCNRCKGPNVGSFDPLTGALVPLFNPRKQKWEDHFKWGGAMIQALSPEGRVTVKLLRLNDADRVSERQRLMAVGLFM
jgi:5-methylcytosine-specific restriction endonuclease McrA